MRPALAALVVAAATLTAFHCNKSPAAPSPNCTPTVAPAAVSLPSSASTARFVVTVAAGCAWSAQSQAGWLSITTGAGGSGTGEVVVAATTNANASPRSGSVIIAGEASHAVSVVPTKVVDTTGAGDAYAAGFLAGLTAGQPLPECGRWASVAAAEAISHFGARPQADLKALVAAR